jgi:hypothetical protein
MPEYGKHTRETHATDALLAQGAQIDQDFQEILVRSPSRKGGDSRAVIASRFLSLLIHKAEDSKTHSHYGRHDVYDQKKNHQDSLVPKLS